MMARGDDDPIVEETALWFARLTSGEATDADRRDFARWLAVSPKHRAAYAALNAVLAGVDEAFADEFATDAMLEPDVLARVEDAVASRRRRWMPKAGMAAAAAIVVAIGSWTSWRGLDRQDPGFASVTTAIGRQEKVRLADGSVVAINTASRLRYRLDDAKRSIFLDRGEAYFKVAKDKNRPFVVTLPVATVTAVGTAFNIRVVGATTDITVTDGIVSVAGTREEDRTRFRLSAGDIARWKGDAVDIRRAAGIADTAADTAWTQGQLVYRNRSVEDVVEDLDRYFPGRLIVDGSRADHLRVSAVINLSDEETVLHDLAEQLPISLTRLPNGDARISVRTAAKQ